MVTGSASGSLSWVIVYGVGLALSGKGEPEAPPCLIRDEQEPDHSFPVEKVTRSIDGGGLIRADFSKISRQA